MKTEASILELSKFQAWFVGVPGMVACLQQPLGSLVALGFTIKGFHFLPSCGNAAGKQLVWQVSHSTSMEYVGPGDPCPN